MLRSRLGVRLLASALAMSTIRVHADDLGVLVQEYMDSKPKVKGTTLEERAEKASSILGPILKRIGEVGSNESLGFLAQEMETAIPEIGAVCAGPILRSKNPSSLPVLLRGFSTRSQPVRLAILRALAGASRDLSPVSEDIVGIANSTADPEVRSLLPPILGKLDSPAAAKAILACVQSSRPEKIKGKETYRPGEVLEAAFTALKGTKDEDVKEWLSGAAFDAARPDPLRLELVARLAGELELKGARDELQKLAGHPSRKVAGAAVGALGKIGFGESVAEIAAALESRKGKGELAFKSQALDALALTGSEEALDVILRYARGSDQEMQALAVGSLALFKGKKRAQEGLIEALHDSDEGTRATALRGIARTREKPVVSALIKVLEKDTEERLRVQAYQALVKLTGQDMGLVPEDWKKWWEVTEPKFQFPDEKAAGRTVVKARELSYFGLEVSSKRVSFLVDASGSMDATVPVKLVKKKDLDEEKPGRGGNTVVGGGNGGSKGERGERGLPGKDGTAKKIDVLKRELSRLLGKLPGETQVNLIPFSKDFKPWQTELQPLAGPGRSKAIDFVKALTTSAGTNVFDTLEFALKDKRVDTIYLLSDGEPTEGRIKDLEGISREIRALNRLRGVTIHCIAFGEESNLLKAIAGQNGGEYKFVNRIEE